MARLLYPGRQSQLFMVLWSFGSTWDPRILPKADTSQSLLIKLSDMKKKLPYLMQTLGLLLIDGTRASQRSANFFLKGPESKHFRCCRPYSLHCNYSALLPKHENGHRQYLNK